MTGGIYILHLPEACARMAAAQKGVPKGPLSEETRKKMSLSRKGRPHSEEHRRKISEAWQARLAREVS